MRATRLPSERHATVAEKLRALAREAAAAQSPLRLGPCPPVLVAVTKGVEASVIRVALEAGHRVFGENRVQEAAAKWPALRQEFDGIELHLIGPLQTNKVAHALALFDVIETLDRPKLARALAAAFAQGGKRPRLFVQVNTGEELTKAGVAPEALDAFLALAREELRLEIEGLMCIPPIDEEPALHFGLLREMARRNHLQGLSMGMSNDYETALAFGASHVRIGTAIFRSRA